MANHPFKIDPHFAAYLGLVIALMSFGFALAAFSAALTVGR